MQSVLAWSVLLAGLGYLGALARGSAPARYLLKPGTMLLIIALGLISFQKGSLYDWLLLAGLVFSVAGDVFLMLPQDRFMHGLSAFLVAHLFYIAAFTPALHVGLQDLPVVIAVAAFAVPLYLKLRPGALERGGSRMAFAVGLYAAVLGAMVWRAAMTGSPVVALGAGLFMLSDALLAWNRFVRKLWWADYAVMSTYFTAQYCLALSMGSR